MWLFYSNAEIKSIKEKIFKCEGSIDRLPEGSDERLAVLQRLVELERRLNRYEEQRDKLTVPESKGIFSVQIVFFMYLYFYRFKVI